MSATTTYTLKHPVTVASREITYVIMRRPKARDLRQLDKISGDVTQATRLVGSLAELSPIEVDELDIEDFTALVEIIGDFSQMGTQT